MPSELKTIQLPRHASQLRGFGRADVHLPTGRVFIAHIANESIEVLDGEQLIFLSTIPGCPDVGDVISPIKTETVFASLKAGGKVLGIRPNSMQINREYYLGSKPERLAFNRKKRNLLVLDAVENKAKLLELVGGKVLCSSKLPGAPSSCAYAEERDLFYVEIQSPMLIIALSPDSLSEVARIPLSEKPLELALNSEGSRAFVSSDSSEIVAVDLDAGIEKARIPTLGRPGAIMYNTQRDLVYCALPENGSIKVVEPESLHEVQDIRTGKDASTFAFDQLRQRLYSFLPRSCAAIVLGEER